MYQTVSADLAEAGPSQVKSARKGRKKLKGVSRKTSTPSLSKLVTEALSASPERAGMSLVALKKTLAASGYDVVKNNSRIKLVLKSLVSKGTLVQTKGTGASGSFRLSKKVTSDLTMVKTKKSPSSKARKLVLSRESKSPKSTKTTNKRAQKPRATAAPEAARVIRKSAGTKGKPQRTSTKARADKSTAGRPKLTQHKTKKAAPKK